MRAALLSFFLAFAFASAAEAASLGPCVAGDNLRPMRPWIAAVIREFAPRSATLAGLLAALRTSSLVVHVVDTPPDGWDGVTRFVTVAGGCRYVRITLRMQEDRGVAAAVLAHELQHALEIDRGAIADTAAVSAWFQRIGIAVGRRDRPAYDTMAARRAGARAWQEIARPWRPGARTTAR